MANGKRQTRGKSLPQQIHGDLRAMMNDRAEAVRRGRVSPLGSISMLETAHGILRFPVIENRPTGPAIGYALGPEPDNKPDTQRIVVLTAWQGVPDLQDKLEKQCPACLRDCDVCNSTGKKVCEGVGCGGEGTRPGPFKDCDAPGCFAKSGGKINPNCRLCGGFGQVATRVTCEMCLGSKQIVCPRCRGEKKYSTGIRGGQTDYLAGRCPTCNGAQRSIKIVRQPIEDHINSVLPGPVTAIGPIFSFSVNLSYEMGIERGTPILIFDAEPDSVGDSLFLLIDMGATPFWAYLVCGVVRERSTDAAVIAQGLARQA